MEKKKILRNYSYSLVTQILSIATPIITMPYLSRTLKAYGLGEYSYAYAVVSYFALFVKLGLDNYGNREIAYVRDDVNKLRSEFWSIYGMQLLCGIAVLGIYSVYVLLFAREKRIALVLCLILFASSLDVNWCLFGLERFKIVAKRDFVIKILTTLFVFIVVKTYQDAWKYALVYSIGVLSGNIINFVIIIREIEYKSIKIVDVSKHFKPNLMMFIPVIAVSIYMTMDKIMLEFFSTTEELGYYHASENIIRVPMAMVTALGTIMIPYMSNVVATVKTSRSDEEKILFWSINFSMFVSAACCFGLMAIADIFVPIFYGEGFDKCITLFYILLPSSLFIAFANVIRTQYLIPHKEDKIYIVSLWFGALANVTFNLLLIPRYASVGAAIGTVVAQSMVCIIQAICVSRKIDIIQAVHLSLKYIIAGLLMFQVVYLCKLPVENEIAQLLFKIMLGIVSYFSVLFVLIVCGRRVKALVHEN